MRMIGVLAAGLVALAATAPVPAAAQWGGPGWNGSDRGWNDGRWDRRRGDWRGRRGWRGDRWAGPGGPGWGVTPGWGGRRDWRGVAPAVRCRWVRGPWGPEQRCFNVRGYRNRW